ncbi:MAG: hypothetical protein WCR04_11215 [Fibrobacteraceae bacterium]
MIPLEKLIPIEAKAREYGYETDIQNGGEFVKFIQWKFNGNFTVKVTDNDVLLWTPDNDEVTIKKFNQFLDEQNKLLELAMMLQENIIEEKLKEEPEV